jgi:anthranilate phosphoribosyltransferase
VRVAKHGNRAASGRVGSFDVLEALGAKIELTPKHVAKTIQKTNLGFMFAPLYHPAMKNIMPVRKELSIRTVFNILGPLTNPAKAQYQILGVSRPELGPILATALKNLGARRALVVYGEDGLDEITITAPTKIWELKNSIIRTYKITPEQFGIKRVPFSKIKGGDAEYNARIIRGVLKGTITDARRDIILLNAAAGLYVYGFASSIKEGLQRAQTAIHSGAAFKKLNEYVILTNQL